jgi:serine/threonine protein kinase
MVALLGPFPDSILLKSQRWQRFFTMTHAGFVPKGDPAQILLTTHCYHQLFEQTGPQPLEQLITEHFPFTDPDDLEEVTCFSDFVRRLLAYVPVERLTAAQALTHPFFTGEPFHPNWVPPQPPRPQPIEAVVQPETSIGIMTSADFLDLM